MPDSNPLSSGDEPVSAAMCENIPHVAFGVDINGIILCCNNKAEQFAGVKASELKGKNLHDIFSRSDTILAGIIKELTIKGEPVDSIELFCKLPGGIKGWYSISVAVVPRRGNISEMLFVFRPLVRHKKEEEELLITKRRYDNLLDNIPGLVYSCDFDRNWTMHFVSDGCKALTGYDPQDFIDNNVLAFQDIIHPDYRDYVYNKFSSNTNKKLPTQIEYAIITKGGEEKWVWEQGKPVFDEKGNVVALEGVIMDLTDRRNIEKERHESQERFRAIFEKSPVAMALSRSDGKVLALNRKFTESLGFTIEDIPDIEHWWPLAYPDPVYREYVKKEWDATLSAIGPDTGKDPNIYKVINKSGQEMVVEFLVSMIGDDCLIIFNDITESARFIDELNKAMIKAEESDKLKSAFLANMSHEIRTPMNGILGFLDLLKGDDLDYRTRLKYMDIVNNSANNLLTIINSIIDISKIEAGVEKVFIESFRINEVVDEVMSLMKILAESKGLKFTSDTGNTEGITMISDKAKVRQILINLVSNGIKFTDNGGVEVRSSSVNSTISLMVADSGIGIKQEHFESIFDRFRQAEVSSAKKYGGTGLGLAISRSYAKMLGGTISLESEPGKGTKFIVTLPVNMK